MTRLKSTTALIISLLFATPGNATVHFDQLSACDDLSKLVHILDSWPSQCGGAHDPLEDAFAARTGGDPSTRICILIHAPSATLAQFDCTIVEYAATRSITCFRQAVASDITDYRQNYLTAYAPAVAQYLDAAAHCAIGNGDASAAPSSLLPPTVAIVAKYDFGFVLPVGGPLVGKSAIVHGYADVDPTISGASPSVEFVFTWRSLK